MFESKLTTLGRRFQNVLLPLFLLSWTALAGPYDAWAKNCQVKIRNNLTVEENTIPRPLEGIADFPLLVRLNQGNFYFSEANAGGSDIRFTNASDVILPYEIERWDAVAKQAEIWVLVDTVKPSDTTQYIKMFWGKADAVSESNGGAVFSTSNGFAAVWHFAPSDTFGDATTNGSDGANFNSKPDYTGYIGHAREFDGDGDYIQTSDNTMRTTSMLSLSAWANFPTTDNIQTIMFAGDSVSDWGGDLERVTFGIGPISNSGGNVITILAETGRTDIRQKVQPGSANVWHYYNGIADMSSGNSGKGWMYKDGALGEYRDEANSGVNRTYDWLGTRIGAVGNTETSEAEWQGKLDELRVETVQRSADWIKFCYETQRDSQAVVMVLSEAYTTIDPPDIAMQVPSQDTTIEPFQPFTMEATLLLGEGTPTYAWYRNNTQIPGATSLSLELSGAPLTEAGDYFVVATNEGGSDTTETITITFRPVDPPDVTMNIPSQDTTLAPNVPFTLQVTLQPGEGTTTFAWYRNSTVIPGETGTFLKINGNPLTESGDYFVVATNEGGSDTTATITITIPKPVTANFSVSPTDDVERLDAVFVDQSTGDIATYRWDFGDGSPLHVYTNAERTDTIRHTYDSVGTYTATLEVIGIEFAGTSTASSELLEVRARGKNPVTIAGRYLSPTQIEVAFGNYNTLDPVNIIDTLYAQRVGLWFGRDNSISATKADTFKTYSVTSMQAVTNFTDTITVPAPNGPGDTTYLFWVCPIWQGDLSPYSKTNASSVRMRPQNPFSVTGDYVGNKATLPTVDLDTAALDSALLTLTLSNGTLDTAGLSSIEVVWSTNALGGKRTLQPEDLTPGPGGTSYLWGFVNPSFEGDTQTVDISVFLKGRNNLNSDTAQGSFVVGWPAPVNPFTLQISGTSPYSIDVTWNDATGLDSVRVVYSSDTIPTGKLQVLPQGIKTKYAGPPPANRTASISGLNANTRYWVGIQGYANMLWTNITTQSRINAVTQDFTSGEIPNTTVLDSAVFDTTKNTVNVYWHLDSIPATLDLGIMWSTDSILATSIQPGSDSGLVVQSIGQSGVTELDFGPSLVFDTTYHIGLWLRTPGSPWSAPDTPSVGTVRIPNFTWQDITLFPSGQDTIKAFNDKVVLWNDGTFSVTSSDRLYFATPSSLPDGVISVGGGFRFSQDVPIPVHVGIRYDSIPIGMGLDDLGLFRDSAGVLLAVHDTKLDPAKRIVYVKTSDFANDGVPFSFFILADSSHANTALKSTSEVLSESGAVNDTATITGNVANVRWNVFYAKNDEAFSDSRMISGYACGSCAGGEQIRWTIPEAAINTASGVRAIVVVDNGVHSDTIDISRSMQRNNSDLITVASLQWTPVWSTAALTNPDATQVLDEFTEKGSEWAYDSTSFRLFRYVEHPENISHSTGDDWLEYSKANENLFRFVPGRVMWLKTRTDNTLLGLGAGSSFSYKNNAEIKIPSYKWADIALPWNNFTVCIGDILDSTANNKDSVQFYVWRQATAGSESAYTTDVVYTNSIPNMQPKQYKLTSKVRTAYSVFNNTGKEITLRIPPIPSSMSRHTTASTAKRSSSSQGWNFKVISESGEGYQLSPVYCGYTPGDGSRSYLPTSPSFLPYRVGIYDNSLSKVFGHVVTHQLENGGFSFQLVFSNKSENSQTIRFKLEGSSNAPSNMEPRVLRPHSDQWEAARDGWISVEVPGETALRRTVAIGDETYLAGLRSQLLNTKLSLVGCYPNPSRGMIKVQYTIPMNNDIGKIAFGLFNVQGQLVWKKDLTEGFQHGVHHLAWDGRTYNGRTVSPGVYIMKMTTFSASGKPLGTFQESVIRVR